MGTWWSTTCESSVQFTTVSSKANEFRADLLAWGESQIRSFPWRDPEASLYEVFVAEFFLTQTPAENVAEVFPRFVARFDSLSAIRAEDESRLADWIKPLGFHNMRAEALKQIATEHDTLPRTVEGLQALPRVGPYVANATLCFALERRLPIVDRNVIRVYDRVFGEEFPEGDRARVVFAESMLPETGEEARTYNLALLDFGAAICQKQEPACDVCFAAEYCDYVGQ